MKREISKVLFAAIFATLMTTSSFAKKHPNHPADQFGGAMGAQTGDPCRVEQKDCYRFSAADRDELREHYEFNWFTAMPDGQHLVRFYGGERLGPMELGRLKAVPSAYSRDVTMPPAGYRFGYYNGMVYAYDPRTGVVADAVEVRH